MRLKNYYNLFLITLLAGFSVCCGDDKEDEPTTLSLSTSLIEAEYEGSESEYFNISSNTSWTVSKDADWLTVNPTSGEGNGTVAVTIAENPDSKKRSATITVTADNLTLFVKVTQEAGATLSVSPSQLELGREKGSTSMFSIQTSEQWTISGVPTWLKLSGISGTGNTSITIETTEENKTASTREATLTVTAGKKTAQAKVVQEGLDANTSVKIADNFSLSNGVFFDFEFGKSVNGFVCELYTASYYDSFMNDESTYDELIAEDPSTVNPSEPFWTYWTINNNPNTEYVLCAIAYKNNGREKEWGPMLKKRVKTMPSATNYDVKIGSITYTSSRFNYTFYKQQRCHHFYSLNTKNAYAEFYNSYPDIYLAYLIKEYIKNQSNYDYSLNDGNYYVSRESSDYALLVWAWGVNDAGEFSNNLNRSYLNLSSSGAEARANAPMVSDKPVRHDVSKKEREDFWKHVNIVRN